MELESTFNPDTLKVGDIISKWSRLTPRETLGTGCGFVEFSRHIIIEKFNNGVKTSVLYLANNTKGSNSGPGEQAFLSFSSLKAGYWREHW